MWQWIKEWQTAKNRKELPSSVKVSNLGIGIERIEKATFLDMYRRVQAFKDTYDGKMPEIIGIENPVTGTEPTTRPSTGSVKARLEAGLGKFNNFTEFWQKIGGRGYSYYYNDIYTPDQEISRLINRQGLNCTDSMQLCHALGTEMGYEVEYVHVMCKQGGHIRGRIKGHEFSNWTRIDPAAALSINSRLPIGQVWCDYPNAHIENAVWINIDDGQ